jgi:hypothetical protein
VESLKITLMVKLRAIIRRLTARIATLATTPADQHVIVRNISTESFVVPPFLNLPGLAEQSIPGITLRVALLRCVRDHTNASYVPAKTINEESSFQPPGGSSKAPSSLFPKCAQDLLRNS